jgi:YidC/Oxa1 family membrane protein insertase
MIIMIIVMFGVIFGVQFWRAKYATPAPDAAAPTVSQTAPPAAQPLGLPAAAAPATPVQNVIQAGTESATVVENELYRITFSNRGAQVTSWILKGFTDSDGSPLDLVHQAAAAHFGYPLSLYTYDPGITQGLASALYVASSNGTPLTSGRLAAPASLTFKYAAGNISVEKTFVFGADYVIHADAVVLRDGSPIRALLSWPSSFGDMQTPQAFGNELIDTSTGGKDEHLAMKNAVGGATLNQPFAFAGTSDQYFAAIFMPDQPKDATVVTLHKDLDVKEIVTEKPWYKFGSVTTLSATEAIPPASTTPKGYARLPFLGAAVGNLSGHDQVRLFVGPKSVKVLKSVTTADGNTLETVLDFGFWGPVSKILFLGLQWVHAHIASNWGWAIVLFTIMINLVLLPLRVQSMRAGLKMQRIQPQIDAIKAKFGNPGPTDPKSAEMNAAVMAYQKEQGVSMFGGCIPALVQFPLLFAFFTMMTRVVELRHAHWGWLHDLSAADPYHILPILMVLTSFLAQYYTPSPGVDPQQQKMMAFMMPAFSGYMTWQYASGLALYWNVGNIIMILQQQVMNRTQLGREIRELALKRAKAKTIGKSAAKTIQGRR